MRHFTEYDRVNIGTDLWLLRKYGLKVERDWDTNIITYGKVKMPAGQFGPWMEKAMSMAKECREQMVYFPDKQTMIKSQSSKEYAGSNDRPRTKGSSHHKKMMLHFEIENRFPFEIFDDTSAPKRYRRGYDIVFDNKETSFSKEAEEFYKDCDKDKLNQILWCIHKNLDLINEHRWTLQQFSRAAYVAMCKYYDINWDEDDLYDNAKIYSIESMVFSVLICKCFTARCGFYNIIDENGDEWNWPEEALFDCECPASCRSLPVTNEWRNRWDNDYLLDLTPKEAKLYYMEHEC